MTEQDRWLDARIRRGLGLWMPKVPDHLSRDTVDVLADSGGQGNHIFRGKQAIRLLSMAASLVLGAILLWILIYRGESGARIMISFPSAPDPVVFPVLPGIASVSLPKTDQYATGEQIVSRIKNQSGAKTCASPRQLQRIDMQLELPHKNIVIVWSQRSDFHLFDEKESGEGVFEQ